MKPLNSATIVVKKPGLFSPTELLTVTAARCPTAFGFGGRNKGELVMEISPKPIPLHDIQSLQEAFKDDWLVMYFANLPKAVLPDDLQPWSTSSTSKPDGTPIHDLLLWTEGDFSAYAGLNGDHTDEFCASDEAIFPRLSKAMVDAGGKVEQFYVELRKPGVQKALMNTFKEHGSFVFLPTKGDAICFGPNLVEFPWGWTSNTHGYVEAAPVKKEEKKEEPKSALAFLRGGSSATKATPDVEVNVTDPGPDAIPEPEPSGGDGLPAKPEKENPEVGVNPAIVGKTPQQLEAAGWKKMFPPAKLARGKARNLWLRVFNAGKLPPDHESSQCSVWIAPDIIDLAQRVATCKGDVENIQTGIKRRREAAKSADGSNVIQMDAAHKELETAELAREELVGKGKEGEKPITRSSVREKHVPPSASGTPSAGNSPYLPTMTDEEKLKAMYVMDEYFDAKNTKRPTPLEIQKGESKHATFSNATGRQFTDLLFLPVEQINKLFDGNRIAVAAFIEMRRYAIEHSDIKLEDLVVTATEVKKEEPKTSVPEVPVTPQTAKKSGGLAFLNRKVG